MTWRVGVLVLGCGLGLASSGFADIITVTNPSFEILPAGGLVDPCGGTCVYSEGADYAIPGWTATDPANAGQFQPGGPSGTEPNPYYNALDLGPTEAYANDGTIYQTVGATVQVGVTYTLQVDIGDRLDSPSDGTVDLLIDGNQYSATGTENPGGFATYTATYIGLAADAGESITIQLNASGINGDQGNFDNVVLSDNLNTSSVPEPTAVILLSTMLLGVAFVARKRIALGL